MLDLAKTIDEVIEAFYKKVGNNIDVDFVKNLEDALNDLKTKQEAGKLTIQDMITMLKIQRNVLIPAAMKQEVDKIKMITEMVKAND